MGRRICTNEDDGHSRFARVTLTQLGFAVERAAGFAAKGSMAIFGADSAFGNEVVLVQRPGEDLFAERGIEVPTWAASADYLIAINLVSVSELKGTHEEAFLDALEQAAELCGAKKTPYLPL